MRLYFHKELLKHGVALGAYPRYRIRKLTPLECWRLQGFSDLAHETVKAAGVSDSQRYKQAGNAVTVNVIDALMPIYVVLTILSTQLGIDIEECIALAYDEIKDRKGRMIDGVFVKEADLPKEGYIKCLLISQTDDVV